MKAICCQLDIVWENKKANFEKVESLLKSTVVPPGSLIVLPEMFATGFSMDVPAIHEGTPSETEAFLSCTARRHQAFVLGGLVTQGEDGRGRNEAVLFSPGGTLQTRYAKLQPFSLGGETQHYTAGREIATFDWNGFKVAPFICYDLRFPELFRAAARKGAQMFAVIANWPVMRVHHWVCLLQARAIENQAYVIGVNRCGSDPKLNYPGRTIIVDPLGEIIADAGDQEMIISADPDVQKVIQWRANFPALADMRADFARL